MGEIYAKAWGSGTKFRVITVNYGNSELWKLMEASGRLNMRCFWECLPPFSTFFRERLSFRRIVIRFH